MAVGNLIGRTGAISVNSLVMDFASVQARMSQSVEDATPYNPYNGSSGGTGTTFLARHVGSGTPTGEYRVAAFGLSGVAGTAPGLDGSTMNGSTGATTIQWGTGCTDTMNTILTEMTLTGARTKATVAAALTLMTAGGTATETWNVATNP
jgi:hypothetical protein